MADKGGAGIDAGAGKRHSCPFFWTSQPPRGGGPAYLDRYPQRFICRGGRHSSLLTYEELLACLEGGGRCPNARAVA